MTDEHGRVGYTDLGFAVAQLGDRCVWIVCGRRDAFEWDERVERQEADLADASAGQCQQHGEGHRLGIAEPGDLDGHAVHVDSLGLVGAHAEEIDVVHEGGERRVVDVVRLAVGSAPHSREADQVGVAPQPAVDWLQVQPPVVVLEGGEDVAVVVGEGVETAGCSLDVAQGRISQRRPAAGSDLAQPAQEVDREPADLGIGCGSEGGAVDAPLAQELREACERRAFRWDRGPGEVAGLESHSQPELDAVAQPRLRDRGERHLLAAPRLDVTQRDAGIQQWVPGVVLPPLQRAVAQHQPWQQRRKHDPDRRNAVGAREALVASVEATPVQLHPLVQAVVDQRPHPIVLVDVERSERRPQMRERDA